MTADGPEETDMGECENAAKGTKINSKEKEKEFSYRQHMT